MIRNLLVALVLLGALGCKDQVRVKVKVRAADSGVATSTAPPSRGAEAP